MQRSVRAAAIVWSVVALVAHSDTGVAFPLWMVLAGTGFLILFAWLIGLTLSIVLRSGADRSVFDTLRSWLAVPMPIVATLLLIWLSVPLTARLFFSGPALRQSSAYLTQVQPSRLQQRPPWVGLFRVREFTQFGGELRFLTSQCGVVDSCGLVFSPGGRPPNRGEDTFVHLYAEWWHWHQSW
jgi:hypothetical protein